MPFAKLAFLSVAAIVAGQVQVVTAADLTPGVKAGIDLFAQLHSGVAPAAPDVPVANLPLSSLWAPGQRVDLSARARGRASGQETVCSIPLREMRIEHPEQFASRKAEFPGTRDEMPQTKGPAPACDAKFLASAH